MGDPAGVGPEIIVKAFADEDFARSVMGWVVGDAGCLTSAASQFAPALSIQSVSTADSRRFEPGVLNVIDLGNVPEYLETGKASPEGGQASVEFIRRAVDLAIKNQVDAVATAPISKQSMHLAGHAYPGHTELLGELTQCPNAALMLAGPRLRVVLVTTHIPLAEVKASLSENKVATVVRLTHGWLRDHVTSNPKIAVTGLNPHCGDGGIFGREETDCILPALELCRKEGLRVEGPFSADSFFGRPACYDYDAVVTMYHDQGMIPIKMDSKGEAVNITLGLPIVRTSVDHGTAYDIAGKGLASPESLKLAVKMASRLAKTTPALK